MPYEKTVLKEIHAENCRSGCPCCAGDYDCNCGAVEWNFVKTSQENK